MNIEQVGQAGACWGLRPLKYSPRDVPHATIETNRTCNLNCRSCYTLDKKSVKSLAQVKGEINSALKKRKLQTITILGGEPTLYPELEAVIAHIKGCGLFCQLLSNGVVLLGTGGDRTLERLVRSRLDRLLLHVDSGQKHIYQNLDAVRRALFSKCESQGLHFGLSFTIYDDDQGRLPGLLEAASGYRYFDGVLAVLAGDPQSPGSEGADMAVEYRSLTARLGLRPSAYVPSNSSDADMRWLFYLYFINARTKKTFSCSPRLDRSFRSTFRILRGRELFATRWRPAFAGPGLILAALFEAVRSAGRLREAISVWRNSRAGRDVRFQFIVVQAPPEVQPETGRFIFCHGCPDATVRNGRLAPVCVADHISPLAGAGKVTLPGQAWAPEIYRHLGEDPDERRT